MVGKEFNKLEKGYTEKISCWVPWYFELLQALAIAYPDEFQPTRILDMGCGNGNVTAILLQRFPQASYTLLDASEEMIASVQRRFAEYDNFHFRESYFQEADFPQAHFDLVVAGLTLHHLKPGEKAEVYPKIHNWLRPGGFFSSSDLYVSKDNEPHHSAVIAHWKQIAREQGTSPEDWDYIMWHYGVYDHPCDYSTEDRLHREAGFTLRDYPFCRGAWASYRGWRSS